MKMPKRYLSSINLFLFCIVATLLSACATNQMAQSRVADLKSVYQVDEGLYRGPRPTAESLQTLKGLGVKTLISFEEDQKVINDIKQLAEEMAFEFVSLPMGIDAWPSDEHGLAFLDVVLTPSKQAVYVYCDKGKDRTGAMVGVYRTIVQGWGPRVAYEEAKDYGFWPYRGDAILKKYIHQLKDRKVFYERVEFYRKVK